MRRGVGAEEVAGHRREREEVGRGRPNEQDAGAGRWKKEVVVVEV